jgi:integrase
MPVKKKRASVIAVGQGKSEIKIYCLRRANGYTFRQCCWYEMGRRQSRSFTDLDAAKLFAQQKRVALANGLSGMATASHRDVEILLSCEQRASRFGTTLPAAIEEWTAARDVIGSASLLEAARFYALHHADLPRRAVSDLIPEFVGAKRAAGYSKVYLGTLQWRLRKFEPEFGNVPIADIATPQVDRFLRGLKVASATRNGVRKSVVAFFGWARKQGYLATDRPTAAEKSMTFAEVDKAPEIFGPEEMSRLLRAANHATLPMLAIGGFAGIRSAEIARLHWEDVLWDQGYIEVKARKAKTKARRLVPIQANLKAWLEPYHGSSGAICAAPCLSDCYRALSNKAGIEWKQNALRHSYASYRLAQIQDAARVALEMGNSPQILFKHYRELVTPEAAQAWFGIVPQSVV